MFNGCTSLASICLDSLETISSDNGMNCIFKGCTALTGKIVLGSLTSITGSNGFGGFFWNCSGITEVVLSSLKKATVSYALNGSFLNCSNLLHIYLLALTETSLSNNSGFNVSGTTGCTIHFPSNLDPQGGSTAISSLNGYPNFAGTNTVLAYDLPSTEHLIDADTVEYERNPKYDTATALAWRVQDVGNTIDWTPFYTYGLTDPTVGTTIYSDAECTTAVTTVDSIA